MNFDFLNSKILEKIEKKFNFFVFYYGYELVRFTTNLLEHLKIFNGTIFLLNFHESIIDKINSQGLLKIHQKEINKKNNYINFLNKNSIISISSKILLLDLITNKISSDAIDFLVIGNKKILRNESKEIFLLKYLIKRKTKFIIYNNDPIKFSNDLELIMLNMEFNNENSMMNVISRNDLIIDRLIYYNMNIKGVIIKEYNLKDKQSEIQTYLINLFNGCLNEIIRLTENNKSYTQNDLVIIQKYMEIFKLKNIISPNFSFLLDKMIRCEIFPFKTRILIKDLLSLKTFLYNLEYLDFSLALSMITNIQRDCGDNSFFKYNDSETQSLLQNIQEFLKSKIFKIEKIENNTHIIEDKNTYTKYDRFIPLNERNMNILSNYSINLKPDIYLPNIKMRKLIEILDKIRLTSVERILIITQSDLCNDNLKEFLSSYYVLNDRGQRYFDIKLRNYLLTKNEFSKRQKIINSKTLDHINKSLIENVMLQKLCIDLCYKFDVHFENLFEKLIELKTNDNQSEDYLPSELVFNENAFYKIDTTCFANNGNNIIPPNNIFLESIKMDDDSSCNLNNLIELILKEKISIVIFYHFNLDLLRNIECIIDSDSTVIKEIFILNNIESYNFKSTCKKIYHEFLICDNIRLLKFSNNFEKNSNEHIDNSLKSSKNIVIDFREMSSKLPFYLYNIGFNLVVGSLEVGDYITSNSVCIERKSITTGDLFESLKSGRLLSQLVKMQKYFDELIILMEFEDDMENIFTKNVEKKIEKNFFKQKYLYKKLIEIKAFSNNKNIHFIWSKNPRMTSMLIDAIKNKFSDYLDVQKCLQINKKTNSFYKNAIVENKQKSITSFLDKTSNVSQKINSNQDTFEDSISGSLDQYEEQDSNYDNDKNIQIKIERFLRKIDGINSNNYKMIFKYFTNLKNFLTSSKEKLIEIFGNNGIKIFNFINGRFNNKINV